MFNALFILILFQFFFFFAFCLVQAEILLRAKDVLFFCVFLRVSLYVLNSYVCGKGVGAVYWNKVESSLFIYIYIYYLEFIDLVIKQLSLIIMYPWGLYSYHSLLTSVYVCLQFSALEYYTYTHILTHRYTYTFVDIHIHIHMYLDT